MSSASPRVLHRLSPRRIATVTTRGFYADGGGLYLEVAKGGSKSWVFRFKVDGRERYMGLGSLKAINLTQARERAQECRRLRALDIDPVEERRAQRAARRLNAANAITFKVAAEKYIAAHKAAWRNEKHQNQWSATLKTYAYPTLGELPVAAIDTGLVLRVLEPIWSTKAETASRLRQRIERVLSWATARGYRSGENPARWKGHLDQTLPQHAKVKRVVHHAAMPYGEVAGFMARLAKQDGVAALALRFAILTAARTGEVIGARWDEVDTEAKTWSIPAERMKAGVAHRVPLSAEALAVLAQVAKLKVSGYVFPGGRQGKPLSNMAMLVMLRRMGRDDITAHGFRSSFRDWAAEVAAFPREVAEAALAHTLENKTEAAYQRGDLFEKRRNLMEAWASYCMTAPARVAKVVPLTPRSQAT